MPLVSIWFVRTSLLSLLMGVTLGAVLLGAKGLGDAPAVWFLLPAHLELVLIGWMLQLAMGVAQWILPRFGARGAARGNRPAWIAYGALNAGLLCVVAASALSGQEAGGLLWTGRMLEAGAVAAFVVSVWSRVRPSGISAM
jgi:heme/copper-type cytochrome/quinol oxidase subunit 1